MSNKKVEQLYQKYISESCTPEEHLELMMLINNGNDDEDLKLLMDKYWEEHKDTFELNPHKANHIFKQITYGADIIDIKQPKRFANRWYKWATAAAIVIFAGMALMFYNKKVSRVDALVLQANATQEHQLIKLADGSTVVLNNNSSLKYPQTFNGDKREVTLIGEGYFDIKHDAGHPFIVHTGKLITTVLGTAFNIKAYKDEKNITVTVTRGKVSVSDENKVLGVITPNQQLSFNKVQDNAIQVAVNSTQTVEWQSKDLFFEDLTMQEAVSDLEQRFNVKITFANDAVKKCRFTGTFLHGEKLKDILQVICDFNNATYKTTDDGSIVINGPGCS